MESARRRDGGGVGVNPFSVLGLEPTLRVDRVREAYEKRVQQWPPEKAPEAFAEIQAAYDAVRTPRGLAIACLSVPLDLTCVLATL